VKVLKRMSDAAFKDALEIFQNNKADMVTETVSKWEDKVIDLTKDIQKQIDSRIRTICEEIVENQRKQNFSYEVKDTESGEQIRGYLESSLGSDMKSFFEEALKKDSELQAIVDRDPGPNGDLFNESLRRFKEQGVKVFTERWKEDLNRAIERVRNLIQNLNFKKETEESKEIAKDSLAQAAEARKKAEESDKVAKRCLAEADDAKKEAQKFSEEVKSLRDKVSKAKEKNKELEAKMSGLIDQIKQSDAQTEAMKSELDKLREQLSHAKTEQDRNFIMSTILGILATAAKTGVDFYSSYKTSHQSQQTAEQQSPVFYLTVPQESSLDETRNPGVVETAPKGAGKNTIPVVFVTSKQQTPPPGISQKQERK